MIYVDFYLLIRRTLSIACVYSEPSLREKKKKTVYKVSSLQGSTVVFLLIFWYYMTFSRLRHR